MSGRNNELTSPIIPKSPEFAYTLIDRYQHFVRRCYISKFTTIDFHVTCKCNQACPYCWGPQEIEPEVDTRTAASIVRKISQAGAQRIVFTGGDPLLRHDIGMLIHLAQKCNLEVALSTTGDELSPGFLRAYGRWIDLISLPIDGSCEAISSQTKRPGHFSAIIKSLEYLKQHPQIDVKLATPVTRHNREDLINIINLLRSISDKLPNRFFYNVFQTYPRSVHGQDWDDLVIQPDEFQNLKREIRKDPPSFRINWLDHDTLDRLYVMIFPNGHLIIPTGSEYADFGPFLEIKDLESTIGLSDFDHKKHLMHSKGWSRSSINS